MIQTDQTTVGKKGEILPKRHLREIAGIGPGDKISIQAKSGEFVIRKILSVEEALALPTIASYSADEAEEAINEESRVQEDLVD